jgi:hypothetical protein
MKSAALDLPSRDGKEPVMKLVEKVADSITGMVMTIFRRHNSEG